VNKILVQKFVMNVVFFLALLHFIPMDKQVPTIVVNKLIKVPVQLTAFSK
jgi:hypothetical protein